MKRIYYFVLFAFALFPITSCNDDALSNQSSNQNVKKGEEIELQKTLNLIDKFANKVGANDNELRNSSSKEKLNVEKVEKKSFVFNVKNATSKLRSSNSGESEVLPELKYRTENVPEAVDIDLYTITFEKGGKEGFSIATSDDRVSRVYAYTENGSLSDTVFNLGLASMLYNIPDILEQDITNYYRGVKTITDYEKESEMNQLRASMPLRFPASVQPVLKTEWHQGLPYNSACPIVCPLGERAPAGCVAIAVAQIIVSKEPLFSRLVTSSTLSAGTEAEDAAKLIYFIGKGCELSYNCGRTGGYLKNS